MKRVPEKVRLIIAFGDVTGFTAFCDAVHDERKQLDPFLEELDRVVERAEHETGWTFTDTGDGFLCAIDLPEKHACRTAIPVLKALWRAFERMNRFIAQMENPRPRNFRIRVVQGYARRKVRSDGRVVLRGRIINEANHLLQVAKRERFVCSTDVRSLLSRGQLSKNGFRFSKLNHPRLLRFRILRDKKAA